MPFFMAPALAASLAKVGAATAATSAAGGATLAAGAKMAAGAGGLASTSAPALTAQSAPAMMGGAPATGAMGGLSAQNLSVGQMAPIGQMKPMSDVAMQGVMRNGGNGLFSNFDMEKIKQMASSMGGGASKGMGNVQQIQPPQLQRSQGSPFTPYQFSRSNYRFRRPIGF